MKRKKTLLFIFIFLISFLSFTSVVLADEPATDIEVDDEYTIDVFEVYEIEAKIIPSDSTDYIYLNTDDSDIVSIWSNSEIYGQGIGSTYITVSTSNGIEKRVKVNVLNPISDIYLRGENGKNYLLVSEQIKIIPTIYPLSGASDTTEDTTLTWSSSDTKIATIDENGVITGVSAGIVTITAETKSGVSSTIQVEVLDEYPKLEYVIDNVKTEFFDNDEPTFTGIMEDDKYSLWCETWYIVENDIWYIVTSNPVVNSWFSEDNRLLTKFELGKTYHYSLTILVDEEHKDYFPKHFEDIVLVVNGEKHMCVGTDIGYDGEKYFFQCDEILSITIPNNIEDENVSLVTDSFEYTGSEIKADVVVVVDEETLRDGEDYTLSYDNNVEVGSATVTVKGIGRYGGTVNKTFTINKANISISVDDIENVTYNGKEQKPNIVVKSNNSELDPSEYTLKYSNNIDVGVGKVIVTSNNIHYSFEDMEKEFNIIAAPINEEKKEVEKTLNVINTDTLIGRLDKVPNTKIDINNKLLSINPSIFFVLFCIIVIIIKKMI